MALQLSGVPFKLTPQDMGTPDIISALTQGQQLGQNFAQFPLNQQILQAKAQYAQPMAQQDLQKAILSNQNQQLVNQNYTPDIQSQIQQRLAAAGLNEQQAKQVAFELKNPIYMNPLAAILNNQANGSPGNIPVNGQGNNQPGNGINPPPQSQQGNTNQGTITNPTLSAISNALQGGNQQSNNNQPQIGNIQDSTLGDYGLNSPKLGISATNSAINKIIGMSPVDQGNLDLYNKQRQDQYDQYSKEVSSGLDLANTANTFKQNLAAYNNAMDNTDLSGGFAGHVPHLWFDNAQKADYAANRLLPDSIASLRSAMKTGQFTNKDIGIAENANLSRTTNPETRKFYTDYANAVSDRLAEYPQLMNIGKNPNYKIRNEDMKTVWSLYQKQNPIVDPDGKTIHDKPKASLMSYLTPDALKSIRETGTYKPPEIKNSKKATSPNNSTFSRYVRVNGKLQLQPF